MLFLIAMLALAPQDPDARSTAAPERDSWCTPERAARCTTAAARGLNWLAAHQTDAGAWTGIVGHKMQNDYIELEQAMSTGTPVRRSSPIDTFTE